MWTPFVVHEEGVMDSVTKLLKIIFTAISQVFTPKKYVSIYKITLFLLFDLMLNLDIYKQLFYFSQCIFRLLTITSSVETPNLYCIHDFLYYLCSHVESLPRDIDFFSFIICPVNSDYSVSGCLSW